MKNICLKFYGLGIDRKMQAYVRVINLDGEIVFEGITYNGEVSLCLDIDCGYRLYAVSCSEEIKIVFYVDSKRCNYYFYFPRSFVEKRIITFRLTDYYYGNIIEKGEIILWQK